MKKLSTKKHWDKVHEDEAILFDNASSTNAVSKVLTHKRRIITAIKEFLGEQVIERMSNYDDYLLWEVILKKHLPHLEQAKVLEIGSAPGEFLVQFTRKYGCIPYGVDYSEKGIEVNRKVFSANKLDPNNVIHADLFSPEFQEQFKGSFDVVVSRGFIEHFENVEEVIDKHKSLLKKGGYLIVSIPNVKGANYLLAKAFYNELISIHNLEIMNKQEFSKLFKSKGLIPLFCDYYGTFSFYLFYTKQKSIMRLPLNAFHKLQPLLNLTFHTLFRQRGAENALFSPSLLFIGRKK